MLRKEDEISIRMQDGETKAKIIQVRRKNEKTTKTQ